eukprot:607302-Amphidinium_carterae.1
MSLLNTIMMLQAAITEDYINYSPPEEAHWRHKKFIQDLSLAANISTTENWFQLTFGEEFYGPI